MIDAILYINLDHRIDRKNLIETEIKKIKIDNLHIVRINAILNKLCGHIGCGKSHILALETAIENDWNSVLILEDDFEFTENITNINVFFDKIEKINMTYDVLLLATCNENIKDCEYDFIKKSMWSTTTPAYIVNKHYYKTLLENFKESVVIMENELNNHINNNGINKLNYCTAIDQHWNILQGKDNFYVANPVLGTQRNSWSDNNCSIEFQTSKINEI